ncbi:MAG: peroxiredoxin-like family protein [Planctomycetota bacterium]
MRTRPIGSTNQAEALRSAPRRRSRGGFLASVFLPASVCVGLCVTLPASATADEPPTLGEQLDELSADFAKRAPEAMREAFAQGIEQVEATGILEKALNVGDKAVDATLLDAEGGKVKLSSLWAEGPLVISFYRGGWCPYCNLQLRAMERSLAELEGAGARLVAVTPELPEKAKKTAEGNKLSLTVLTDKGNTLAGKMGVAFRLPDAILPIYKQRIDLNAYNGDDSYTLPLAATYVIDTAGVIRYAFLDADYKKRAEPADVVAAVKRLQP